MDKFFSDVTIIGCGVAGLRAAIAAAESGFDVCVISKTGRGLGTATIMSRGHFAGARTGWTPQQHFEATLRAGKGLNKKELVDMLVLDAPERLEELVRWGLQSSVEKGQLYVLGPPPAWGREIVRCLLDKALQTGVRFRSGLTVVRIQLVEGSAGVLCFANNSGEWVGFFSRSLVLATGGAGALFLRHDNPQRMLGEGYHLALAAGATLRDMEFFQFFPLSTAEPHRPQFPIPSTIASRGRLINGRGEELLEKYEIHERPADVYARDRLSQALMYETINGDSVFLDLRDVPEREWNEDALDTAKILFNRFQVKSKPLQVMPTAHFSIGGVCTDAQGKTSVPGLYAAGEVAGGLHGANRMAGNGLTEALVFGARAGEAASLWAGQVPAERTKKALAELTTPVEMNTKSGVCRGPAELKLRLRKILWENGGILRNQQGLVHAIEAIKRIKAEAYRLSLKAAPAEVQNTIELQLGSNTAMLIVQAALRREESRGAHFREDFPAENNGQWQGHLEVSLSRGRPVWSFKAI